MLEMVDVEVLRNVPVSDDGIKIRQLVAGTPDRVRLDLLKGLTDEGYVKLAGATAGGKEDAPPVDIPADWHSLHHATKKKLAREISGDEVDNTDAAEAIIEAELARRVEI
ncbi:hypothetical protein [Ancylobacter sp. IITR112]|uniref:hypothetical protein n=1 Tax=Ancylobacter sp. IITR112 TaxID=3138073 RepID=UPI00352B2BEB